MISFRDYVGLLLRFAVSSSFVLGLIIGIGLLVIGGTTARIDLTIELGRFDGFWMLPLLPVLVALITLLTAPLSYFVFRWMPGRATVPRD
ncbi:MAG: hypothetical protein V2I25_02875 [Woeseiaceae bacterium]|jgi:hypothetical protein|nr:hypothetical protein [Woeseiaceae bacterium]